MKISCESRKINEIVIRLEPELAEELCEKLRTLKLSDNLLHFYSDLEDILDHLDNNPDLALEA